MAAPELEQALGVRLLYTPHRPEPPQHAYLWLNRLEALYGGAAGGGKSDALLMGALQYVDVPRYAAILFRRTFADLNLPGGLIPRSAEWLGGTDARWSERDFRWTFPSAATLSFGYLQTKNDRYRYGSSEFQFVGFDELTEFAEADYTFLFSRLRKPSGIADDDPLSRVPLRMRAASNPGGRGHAWVKRRLVDRRQNPDDPEDSPELARARVFVPARLEDNPHVDQESYRASLANLSKVERERLLNGDWDVDTGDRYFPGAGVNAALQYGAELDALDARSVPPPAGGKLTIGNDWADRKFHVIGWPLEGGGMYVVRAVSGRGLEPGKATELVLAELAKVRHWQGRPRVRDPLELVSDVRYDAAGLDSQRTFNAIARRRRRDLRVTKVPFGSYKREAYLWARTLLENAEEHTPPRLAISQDVNPLFVDQVRNLLKDPKDEELPLKPATETEEEARDDGPDAMAALLAPVARRHRARAPIKRKLAPTDPRAVTKRQRP